MMHRSSTVTLEEAVAVECLHCHVVMTSHLGTGGNVRYFHCPGCARWVSSPYASDVLRADGKVRTVKPGEQPRSFNPLKGRLSALLAKLEKPSPWAVLGVSHSDSPERVRARYRELAFERHPDRGGSLELMRELNEAYEAVLAERERVQAGRAARALLSLNAPLRSR